MSYVDANRQETHDPLYASGEAAFAHTCSGARVHDYFDHVTQYLMNPGSSVFRSAYASYIKDHTAGHPVDAIFQDDSVPPGIYAPGFYTPTLPCGYSNDQWLADQRALQASINHDTIYNGLSVSSSWSLLDNPSTIGGNYESCYTSAARTPEQSVYVWVNIQNAHLAVTSRHKLFECMAMDRTPAADAIRSRLYTIASFLMTYNPSYSMLWETYATPSGLSIMPESQLVPADPVVAPPSRVESLRASGGAYVREYRQCYYAGRAIGPCAMVVNNERLTLGAPRLALGYHHTMTLRGDGVLDGGTASFDGPAPPSSLAPGTAFVAVR